MALQFAMLGSGSSGNSALIRAAQGAGLMIDCGLGVRDLTRRLESVGAGWNVVRALLLTHTHGDHVNIASLTRLLEQQIRLYCHEGQRPNLRRFGVYERLEAAGLVHYYDDRPFLVPCGFWVEPIELSHDGGPTYGFRVEGRGGRSRQTVSIGYLADSGIWTERMADALSEVDLLGVEFNHDVEMQKNSGRSPVTIARNLGKYGHLSNAQAGALVADVLNRSGSRTPRQLVLLHISHQCNEARLALAAAREAVRASGKRLTIHAAEQGHPSAVLQLHPRRASRAKATVASLEQPMLLPF